MSILEGHLYKLPASPKDRGVIAIYVIADPITNEVRYVGQSNTPSTRKEAHALSRGELGQWMRQYINDKTYTIVAVLEEVPAELSDEREQYYINYFKDRGARLFNTTDFSKSRGGKYELNIRHMGLLASWFGGMCLSESYAGPRALLTWRCARGHEWETTPNSVRLGYWCGQRECVQDRKLLAKDWRAEFKVKSRDLKRAKLQT